MGDWCLNQSQDSKRWKSNPRYGTNGARENARMPWADVREAKPL